MVYSDNIMQLLFPNPGRNTPGVRRAGRLVLMDLSSAFGCLTGISRH